jgi:ABC-type bacteriocin/lantibiotic exporter with double-glycine peptidase domain
VRWNKLIKNNQGKVDMKLRNIKLIKQPANSPYCGASCIKMVQNFFISKSDTFEDIWREISDISPEDRRYCKTYKMGQYLEKYGLFVSIIKFSNLRNIFEYCSNNNIPAIMNIHSFENSRLGHYVLFINYRDNTVVIRDPENEKRISVSYRNLAEKFVKISDDDEIGGNIIILATNIKKNEREYLCPYCGYNNTIDIAIENSVTGLVCVNCDKDITINNN